MTEQKQISLISSILGKKSKKRNNKVSSEVSNQIEKDRQRILHKAETLINLSDEPIRQKDLMVILNKMFKTTEFVKYWESKGHLMSVTLAKALNESTAITTFKGSNGFDRFYSKL